VREHLKKLLTEQHRLVEKPARRMLHNERSE
jgi:hypothetical protein